MNAYSPVLNLIQNELATDRIFDDVTASLLVDATSRPPVQAEIFTKENGIFCGENVVSAFGELFRNVAIFTPLKHDGERIRNGDRLVRLELPGPLCLSIERTLLNFLGLLCGTASLTRRYVDAVEGFKTRILATRKTLPGLKDLQLQAVRAGGGYVHRRCLSDGILIKENHQQFLAGPTLIERARQNRSPLHRIEIEVQNFEQLAAVLKSPPDVIMLDNFNLEDTRRAIHDIGDRCEIEISGGINLETVRAYAELGAHYISVGRLTHSVPALDLSLDIHRETV